MQRPNDRRIRHGRKMCRAARHLQYNCAEGNGRRHAATDIEGTIMRRVKLDRIDRQILRDLQENGRTTNVELAKRAGISAPPCLRRVRALEEAKVIRGYHADVDAEELGFGVTVFALVGLQSQAEPDLRAFEQL